MYVNTAGLHSRANTSNIAADHAYEGTGTLSRWSVNSGIFGDFDTAEAFQHAVTDAHERHATMINHHCEQLSTLGDKAHGVAAEL